MDKKEMFGYYCAIVMKWFPKRNTIFLYNVTWTCLELFPYIPLQL